MEDDIFRNTILDIYPSYIKKTILNQVVEDGLFINNKKKNGQMTLNFTNCVDVTEDNTLDNKILHMLNSDDILAFV